MALGKRKPTQQASLIASTSLPVSPGHVFYRKLSGLLRQLDFDDFVEELCKPYYADGRGRPSIPPGVYFRILLIGYFEDLGSQREMAWRIADSLSLREFLRIPLTERTPDHSSLTRIRQRLPLGVYVAVFQKVLGYARRKGLLKGRSIGVDSSTIEANAAMRSIVRKDTKEDWKEYVERIAEEAGAEVEDDDDRRNFDRRRKDKKVSNKDWESGSDPDSRIMRMKDGTTRLGYKLEHAVDLDAELIVSGRVTAGDAADTATLQETVFDAGDALLVAGAGHLVGEVVADKGYHSLANLEELTELGIRTYLPAQRSRHRRRWKNKPPNLEQVFRGNGQRVRGRRGRKLQRLRAAVVERVFAHVLTTGGGRRTRIRGLQENRKVWSARALAHNLGRLMRWVFGVGSPKETASGLLRSLAEALYGIGRRIRAAIWRVLVPSGHRLSIWLNPSGQAGEPVSSTGC